MLHVAGTQRVHRNEWGRPEALSKPDPESSRPFPSSRTALLVEASLAGEKMLSSSLGPTVPSSLVPGEARVPLCLDNSLAPHPSSSAGRTRVQARKGWARAASTSLLCKWPSRTESILSCFNPSWSSPVGNPPGSSWSSL